MKKGMIDLVVVGTDRTVANGDVANKIGTYTVAVLAKEHGIPFFVAAPTSTIDFSIPSGDLIPIEERGPEEVTRIMNELTVAPEGVKAANPAFDVTPRELVTAIINPSHKLAQGYPLDTISEDGQSLMPLYNSYMTVQELIDIVAFLQPHYDVYVPQFEYRIYP